ncbi:tRNA (N(6)-L-threonylcarbamoyladenosine(37)-C(2))-methylthiotransferase MtaB [Diplocloster agilis]|uniref:tRNA (N(6)-L-threonylcarbamoyladenosine(37)-C(2))- methylthiotransferase MtaB n=1 Tax=Diplocloster agilis TaxID=2850323 RepID=UPI000821BC5F|nr:tRNA (N(6)-L-threonylcarbamoyladenosine(37)-C(2))-methylthiotransferase MtaB [Suonthocola fibrivorans]MCU6734141.1 tRNA (N(6)-L-threonylcarbamoyladenosine(37)-C(2))-methylthiotransferase MtaB [Suonthocola fibrivorans]SCJ25090.1 (Dimethylallyl)adenosine tRNA methylthiotransferase MiaB [uncultured Clostridium sp.]
MKRVALHNLGCKVNAYETEAMQQMLEDNGYEIVPFTEPADVYIINTCTVTNIADRKSRQMLHRAKAKNPNACVVAAGCYVQAAGEALLQDEAVDLVIGNNRKKDLIRVLRKWEQDHKAAECITDIATDREYEELTLGRTTEHTRAYLKVQDGCNQFCSYCIIPYARGRVRSRKMEDVIHEVKRLASEGYQEVVLTGIHLSSYGVDFEPCSSLLDLILRVQEVEGIERIRLGSLEPRIITEEFVSELSKSRKFCPHFHLSLQSGCDDTLKRMNRHYTTGEYFKKCRLIREYFEHPALTTDIIVGFPQETEEEFTSTRDFLEKVSFYETHIFKYSRRQGTKAAVMEGQIPEPVKAVRSNELLALNREKSKAFRDYYLNKTQEVLFEEMTRIDGVAYQIGHTKEYVKVAVKSERERSNQLCRVRVTGYLTDEIMLAEFE